MSYSSPAQPEISNPKGLDKEIKKIQVALDTLPWLERSFARSFTAVKDVDGSRVVYPEVEQGKGKDFLDVLPNDNLRSFSFVMPENNETFVEYNLKSQVIERGVSLIFFVNLEEIDDTKSYRYTELLKQDVLIALKAVHKLELTEYSDELEQVYREFTISNLEAKFFKRKFAALRFDGVLSYDNTECNLSGL